MKINRIAIIPARSGSKRIKNKNVKLFCDKPIISYPINELKKSNLFNKIHVSTDSKKISDIVKQYNVEIDFLRPKKLSSDNVIINDVLRFVLKQYKKMHVLFDEVWLIYPCSPLITKKQIISASKMFNKTEKKYPLMSFREYDAPLEWAFRQDKKYYIPINKKKLLIDSKKIKKHFYESATFVVYKYKHIFQKKVFSKYYGYELKYNEAIDIDYPSDWKKAEFLYTMKKNNK